MTYDASRTIVATCTSLLDAIFTDGFGDPVYATQTHGPVTELLRMDPATGFLYPIATICWPCEGNKKTTVMALDIASNRKIGNLPPTREIIPGNHVALWFHTMFTLRKDVYEHFSPHPGGRSVKLRRSIITHRRRRVLSRRREISCEIQLFPDGKLLDDADAMVAAVLLLCSSKEWRGRQSALSQAQLESCLAVTHLRMDTKRDQPTPTGEREGENYGVMVL